MIDDPSEVAVDEPLDVSAPLARSISARFCGRDPLSASTCAWYHGFWQYVRLLGLGAAPSVHAAHLLPTLRSLARTARHERVLISGSADYAMLAHLISAYKAEGAALHPLVVDICSTPLHLCRWYARRLAVEIDTRACDIRAFEPSQPFDVVCTHAFLGYFSRNERPRVVERWAASLRPGGRIVTIQRIRPRSGQEIVRFTRSEQEAFVARIDAALESVDKPLDVSRSWLVAAAREYADRFWTYPMSSKDELARLFEDASFTVEMVELSVVDEGANETVSGPTLPTRGEYAFVVAARQ